MPIEIHELRLPTPGPAGQAWELAATVFLPPPLALASGPNLLVLLPGAAYTRGYFNLPVPGFSQAMYHAGRGNVIVTIDPLGVGDSSADDGAAPGDAVAALDTAVKYLEERLRAGTLLPGLGPVTFGAVTGAGQSLGGHLVLAAQAAHGTFKAIALLGSSVLGARFAQPSGELGTSTSGVDFARAFHWGDTASVDPATVPSDLASLIGVDVAIGLPQRQADAPWASRTIPSYVVELTSASGARAGEVTSPVLLAAGERDVTHPLEEEAAMFTATTEVDTFLVPQAAHMHNFAETRELLWKRLDTFVHHSSAFDRRVQSTAYAGRFTASDDDEESGE